MIVLRHETRPNLTYRQDQENYSLLFYWSFGKTVQRIRVSFEDNYINNIKLFLCLKKIIDQTYILRNLYHTCKAFEFTTQNVILTVGEIYTKHKRLIPKKLNRHKNHFPKKNPNSHLGKTTHTRT